MRPALEIDACRASHRRLLTALVSLTDDDLRVPSRLPKWSRAHVVAHLANKSDAHVALFGGAAIDEVRRLFPVGFDQDRAADDRASCSSDELRADLEQSFVNLESAWDALDDDLWDRRGIMTAGPRTMAEIITHHLRDVEVHHVDLGIGYRNEDWPAEFVEGELERRLRCLPDRCGHSDLLAWLLGRAPAPELGPW